MHQLDTDLPRQLYEEAVALLRTLIALPSFSKEETATADAIALFLIERGIAVQRIGNNVIARNQHFDPAKPTILLNSHHDTVRPARGYSLDPFQPLELDGKLFGLGSNDAGGCLVSLIATFLYYFSRQDLRYNLILAATAEEEISGINGIEAVLQFVAPIDFAIVGEPTQMNMAVAEKGLMVLDCTSHGKSGHAARDEGDNAIYKAMADIAWFQSYAFPKVSDLLGPVKMTVTVVNAGTQHNVVPDTCTFVVDIRINECYSHDEVLAVVTQHVHCDVKPRSVRLRSTAIGLWHPVIIAGKDIGLAVFGSATLSDKALMPFPAVKMGPGDSARSHTADEFIYLTEIKRGIEIYVQLLKAVL